jgi:hypothetical protein
MKLRCAVSSEKRNNTPRIMKHETALCSIQRKTQQYSPDYKT